MTRLPTESWDIQGLPGPELKVGPYCSVPGCQRIIDHSHHITRRSFLQGQPMDWVKMPDGVEIGNLTGMCYAHHQLVTENKAVIDYEDGVFLWCYEGQEAALTPQPPPLHGEEMEQMHDGRTLCPGCGRPMPKPKIETPSEEKKPRGTWAVSIPVTEQENGYEVLDELLNATRDELDKAGISYGHGNKTKYHILATGLAMFVTHASEVLADS